MTTCISCGLSLAGRAATGCTRIWNHDPDPWSPNGDRAAAPEGRLQHILRGPSARRAFEEVNNG